MLESEQSYEVCVYYWNVGLCSPRIRFLCNDLNVSLLFHLIEVKADFARDGTLRLKPTAGQNSLLSLYNGIRANP